MVVKEKNLVLWIILSLVTCGICYLVWIYQISEELRAASGDQTVPSGIMAVLLPLVTCNIYGLYWAYKCGKVLPVAKSKYGLPGEDKSILFLVLDLLGLSIVTIALFQNEMNEIARTNPTA